MKRAVFCYLLACLLLFVSCNSNLETNTSIEADLNSSTEAAASVEDGLPEELNADDSNAQMQDQSIPDDSFADMDMDNSEADYKDPYPIPLYTEYQAVVLSEKPEPIFYSRTEAEMNEQFLLRSLWLKNEKENGYPDICSLNPDKNTNNFPLCIEKRWFGGERLGFLFWSDRWVGNRTYDSADAGTNWLTIYPDDNAWEEAAWQLKPQEGMVIQGVALGEKYLYWTETSPMPLDIPGWDLYVMDLESGETERLLSDDKTSLLTFPSLVIYEDMLYLLFTHEENYGELVRYNPKSDNYEHIAYTHCLFNLYYGLNLCDNAIVTVDYDGTGWYMLLYDLETAELSGVRIPLKYPSEYIYRLQKADEWIIYSTNMLLTYAYNLKTGEIRIVTASSQICLTVGDRYLLLEKIADSFVVYDLQEDVYCRVPESELCTSKTGSEFTYYGITEANEQILIYEGARDVSPALIVKLYAED